MSTFKKEKERGNTALCMTPRTQIRSPFFFESPRGGIPNRFRINQGQESARCGQNTMSIILPNASTMTSCGTGTAQNFRSANNNRQLVLRSRPRAWESPVELIVPHIGWSSMRLVEAHDPVLLAQWCWGWRRAIWRPHYPWTVKSGNAKSILARDAFQQPLNMIRHAQASSSTCYAMAVSSPTYRRDASHMMHVRLIGRSSRLLENNDWIRAAWAIWEAGQEK